MFNFASPENSQQPRPLKLKRGRREIIFALRLTSMIDMFTILLFFLLKNYSAEGQVIMAATDLRLPVSTASKIPTTTSIVTITPDLILLDGRPLLTVKKAIEDESLLLKNLYNDLKAKRIMAEVDANIDERMTFRGEVTIQADEDIPFEILKRVLYTCGQVGYNNMLLAVISSVE